MAAVLPASRTSSGDQRRGVGLEPVGRGLEQRRRARPAPVAAQPAAACGGGVQRRLRPRPAWPRAPGRRRRRRSAGLRTGCRLGCASCGRVDRPAAARPSQSRVGVVGASLRPARASVVSLARSMPARIGARRRRTARRGSGIAGCGRPTRAFALAPSPAPSAPGPATSSSSGTFSSAMRLTNEVLAPFSSRRRTR